MNHIEEEFEEQPPQIVFDPNTNLDNKPSSPLLTESIESDDRRTVSFSANTKQNEKVEEFENVEMGQTLSNMIKTSAHMDFSAFGLKEKDPQPFKIQIYKDSDDVDDDVEELEKQEQNAALKLSDEEVAFFEKQEAFNKAQNEKSKAHEEKNKQESKEPIKKAFSTVNYDTDDMGHANLGWQLIYLISDVFLALITWAVFDAFFSELYYVIYTNSVPFWLLVVIATIVSLLPLLLLFPAIIGPLQEQVNVFNVVVCCGLFISFAEDQYIHLLVMAFAAFMSVLIIIIICTLDRTHPRKHRIFFATMLGLILFLSMRYVFHSSNFFLKTTFTVLLLLIGLLSSISLLFERYYYTQSRRKCLKACTNAIKQTGDLSKTVATFLAPPKKRAPELHFDQSSYHLTKKDLKEMIKISKSPTKKRPVLTREETEMQLAVATSLDGDNTFSPDELQEILQIIERKASTSPSFLRWSKWWRWSLNSIGFASLLFVTFFFFLEASASSRYLNLPVQIFPPIFLLTIMIGYFAVRWLVQVPKLLCAFAFLLCTTAAVLLIVEGLSITSSGNELDLTASVSPLAIVILIFLGLCFAPIWLIKIREMIEEAERCENILSIDLLPLISSSAFSVFFLFYFCILFMNDGASLLSGVSTSGNSYIILAVACFSIVITSLILKLSEYYFDKHYSDIESNVFWSERFSPLAIWYRPSYMIVLLAVLFVGVGVLIHNLQISTENKTPFLAVTSWSTNAGYKYAPIPGGLNSDCMATHVYDNHVNHHIFCLQNTMSSMLNGNRDSNIPVYSSSASRETYFGFPSISDYSGTSLLSSESVSDIRAVKLPSTLSHHHHSFIQSQFTFNNSQINFICVNFDQNDDPEAMISSVLGVAGSSGPTIIVGHFGVSPNGQNSHTDGNDRLSPLFSAGFSSAFNPLLNCTVQNDECLVSDSYATLYDSKLQKDFIFYRELHVEQSSTWATRGCTDHYPVNARFSTE